MESFLSDEEHEMSSLRESRSSAAARNGAFKSSSCKDKVTHTHAVKVYRLVAAVIGLVCVLQAALNVSLSLVLYLKAGNKTLTEEVDELWTSLGFGPRWGNLTEEGDELSVTYDVETRCKNLTEERDALKKQLVDFASQKDSLATEKDELKKKVADVVLQRNTLTAERDALKKINVDLESSNKNLTEDRDDLKKRLIDLASQKDSLATEKDELKKKVADVVLQRNTLTAERDALKKINVVMEATSRNLTTERDDLKRRLKTCTSQQISLTNERDGLKRTNSAIESKSQRLSVEKSQLSIQLTTCRLEKLGLTTEKDKLTTKLSDFAKFVEAKWEYFNGSFYYISTTQMSWLSSRHDCQRKGANLVIINSKEEEKFTRKFQKQAWIGLTDRIREGSWKWVDGTALTESYWRFGEPNHFRGRHEDCAEIQSFDSERSWDDAQCANRNYWICEKNFDI